MLWVLLFIISLIEILAVIYAILAAIYCLRGAPYVPTTNERIINSIKLANIKPGMRVADLGSGDGKVLIHLAKMGCIAHGYEIHPFLSLISQWNIRRAGLKGGVFIHKQDFWKVNLSEFDLIYIYGITYIMKRLEEKLNKELKPGAQIVCIVFPLPKWKPAKTYGKIFYYVKQ